MTQATTAVAAKPEGPKDNAKPVATADAKKADKVTEEIENAKPFSPLLASSWKARESGIYFNTHEVVPDIGTPFEHLGRAEYWSNVSQKFRPGDTILAYPRDGAWYVELIVWDAGQNWAHVTAKFEPQRRAKFQAI